MSLNYSFAQINDKDDFDEFNLFNCKELKLDDIVQYPPRIETFSFDINNYRTVPVYAQESIARKSQDYRFNGLSYESGSRKGIQVINKLQGLPGSFVHDMITDKERNVWMVIDLVGLVRFDGHNFKVYTMDEGLVSDRILSLEPKKEGRGIWVITKDGISDFDGLVFRNIYFEEDIDSRFISSKNVQGDTLWLGTKNKGLWAVHEKSIQVYDLSSGLASNNLESVYSDSKGRLWLTHEDGSVEYIKDDNLRRFYFNTKSDKPIILGEHQNGFYIYDRASRVIKNYVAGVVYETKLEIPVSEILDFGFARDGIWIITSRDGIYKYANNEFCAYMPGEEIPSYTIESFTIVDNQIWIGSYGKGIHVIRSLDYNYYNLKDNNIEELGKAFLASSGVLYFGAYNTLYKKYKGSLILEKQDVKVNKADQIDRFYSFSENIDSTVWTMSIEGNLFKEEGGRFVEVQSLIADGVKDVFDIEFDASGNLWIATWGNGLFCKGKDGSLKKIIGDLKDDESIIEMEFDDHGDLWLATPNGILRQNGEEFKRYDLSNFPIENSFSMFKDSKGRIWLGAKRGLTIYNGKEFKFLRRNSGLLSDNIVSIAEDSQGRIWLTTELGINVLENFDVWEQLQIYSYNYEEGMNELEYYYNSSLFTEDDLLWMLGPSGLVILDTKNIGFEVSYDPEVDLDQVYVNETSIDFFQLNDESRRKAYIEEMSYEINLNRINIKDQSQERFSGNYSLPYDYNSVSFAFLAKQWRSSFDIQYRYRLLGLDDKWCKPTKDKTVSYWKLPGFRMYTFEVQSRIQGGRWSASKKFNFYVRGNIWLVIGILSIIASLGLSIFYFWRSKKNLKDIRDPKNIREELKEHIKLNDSVHDILNEESASSVSLVDHAKHLAAELKLFGDLNSKLKHKLKYSDKQQFTKELEADLRSISKVEDLWLSFDKAFERNYPDFDLKVRSIQLDLSTREINICKLLITGLRNPEIANILFIQADSVKKARQRLNKKIKDAGMDFDSFIQIMTSTAVMG